MNGFRFLFSWRDSENRQYNLSLNRGVKCIKIYNQAFHDYRDAAAGFNQYSGLGVKWVDF